MNNDELLSKIIAVCVSQNFFDDNWFEKEFIKFYENLLINLDDSRIFAELSEWEIPFNEDKDKMLNDYVSARKKVIQKAYDGSFQRWFLATFYTEPIIKALKLGEIKFK